MYTYDEVYQATLEYFNGDELATKVWVDKYALSNNEGELLEKTPTDMHHRLAKEFARIEKNKFKHPLNEQEIFDLFDKFKYIVPQGSPSYGIGNNYSVQSLGNCFGFGYHPYDSYGGICYADEMLVQLSKRRCGVGLCLNNIRPKGMPTRNSAKTTDGIAVFVKRYGNSTREVAQMGRRGGSLQALSVHHPEIETFINIKRIDKTQVTGSNLSVIFTDEFMNQLLNNEPTFEQRWPIEDKAPIISKQTNTKQIWDEFINASWESAEPGALFIDTARKYSMSHIYGKIDPRFKDIVTNVCGEIWMGMDSCRLMLLNLSSYVDNPFTKNAQLDYTKFKEHIQIAQRLLDDMVDLEIEKIERIIKKIDSDPEPDYIKKTEKHIWTEFLEVAKLGRRTGLGLTGVADALAFLNIKYGSQESFDELDKIYKTLAISSTTESCLMAKELGTFELYNSDIEKDNIFLQRLFSISPELEKLHSKYGRRNISNTTMSPAGSMSLLTQSSSGIEPVYLLEHIRKYKTNTTGDYKDKVGDNWIEYTVRHHGLQKWIDITRNTDITQSPYHSATANDINWKDSIKIQAIAQKWLSHSISKTCNLPANTTKETISQIFIEAYKQGCKGFTIYRDGCRDGVMSSKGYKNIILDKRPRELPCDVYGTIVNNKSYFVLVGLLDGVPYEIFAGKNGMLKHSIKTGKIIRKKKGFYKAIFEDDIEIAPITATSTDIEEAITRLVSTSLRAKVDINLIVTQLEKVGGESPEMHSFAKALSRVLKKYIKDGTKIEGETCPDCGGSLIRKEGCWGCENCNFIKCQ